MRWAIGTTEERRATRMHQMMKRLHVDVLALIRLRNGDAYAEARSRCLRCDDSSICLLWLDKGGPDAGPDFCPNLEFFRACNNVQAPQSIAARRAPPRLRWRRAKARGRI
jgi:uncharacterized protein DUF6455